MGRGRCGGGGGGSDAGGGGGGTTGIQWSAETVFLSHLG